MTPFAHYCHLAARAAVPHNGLERLQDEALRLLESGYTRREIAERYCISIRTVTRWTTRARQA